MSTQMPFIFRWIMSFIIPAPIIPKRLLNACETMANINQTPPLRISGTWKNVMLNSSTVELFHFLYWKVRSNEELQPKAMTCLIQLSTLNGSVFISGGSEASFMYFSNYLNYYLELLKKWVSNSKHINCKSWPQIWSKNHKFNDFFTFFLFINKICEKWAPGAEPDAGQS